MGLQEISDRIEQFYDKFDHGQGQYSEERVRQRAEYHALMRKTDYMSIDEYNNFNSSYAGKKPQQFIRYAPTPQLDGYYKVRVFGNLRNPNAKWEGYLPTWTYFLYQLKCTLRFSMGAFGGVDFDFSIIGVIVAIVVTIALFFAGILIRLPISIILTLIQFFVVLFASKKEENTAN